MIWAGSDDGFVQVTRNGGTNWKNVTPKGLGEFARISLIEASPFRAGTAYVAANRYQQDDFKPYVFRTDDYGETWTAITNGVARERLRARDPRGHPSARSCCTSAPSTASTCRSTMAANWQSLRQNLPDTPVHDIAVADRDLVIATHGRGFYVMDNISPLRQGGLQTTTRFPSLQAGGRAARPRSQRRGRLLPEAAGAEGQDGIPRRAGQGDPRRSPARPPTPSASRRAERRRRRPAASAGTASGSGAGLHRLTWDMRYPGATDFPGLIMWAASSRGPLAPPGDVSGARHGGRPDRDAAIRRSSASRAC